MADLAVVDLAVGQLGDQTRPLGRLDDVVPLLPGRVVGAERR